MGLRIKKMRGCLLKLPGESLPTYRSLALLWNLELDSRVVWRVAVHGGCLYREGEAGRGRVDFRGGAEYPQGGETSLILKEEVEWWEAGLYGQYV